MGVRVVASTLTEALEPVIDHYRGIEERHRKRERLGDLLKAGAATPEDVDELNRLDAEER